MEKGKGVAPDSYYNGESLAVANWLPDKEMARNLAEEEYLREDASLKADAELE